MVRVYKIRLDGIDRVVGEKLNGIVGGVGSLTALSGSPTPGGRSGGPFQIMLPLIRRFVSAGEGDGMLVFGGGVVVS